MQEPKNQPQISSALTRAEIAFKRSCSILQFPSALPRDGNGTDKTPTARGRAPSAKNELTLDCFILRPSAFFTTFGHPQSRVNSANSCYLTSFCIPLFRRFDSAPHLSVCFLLFFIFEMIFLVNHFGLEVSFRSLVCESLFLSCFLTIL